MCEIKQLQCESNGPGSLLYSTASVCYINTKVVQPIDPRLTRDFPIHSPNVISVHNGYMKHARAIEFDYTNLLAVL